MNKALRAVPAAAGLTFYQHVDDLLQLHEGSASRSVLRAAVQTSILAEDNEDTWTPQARKAQPLKTKTRWNHLTRNRFQGLQPMCRRVQLRYQPSMKRIQCHLT